MRLSQGDPLLIKLYVDELTKKSDAVQFIRADELEDMEPGLEGFMGEWWRDQILLWGDKDPLQEARVRSVLYLLATAFGPLSKDDVLAIAPSDLKLSSFTIEGALRPLQRFAKGDGKTIDTGYTFNHPRLGYFFYDQIARMEKEEWDQLYIEYGSHTLRKI